MKIDLRVLYCSNTKRSDTSVGEFAKKATKSKLYSDKLKQAIISKYHLNTFLLSGLSSSAAIVPLVQIMGFDCHLCVLRQVEDFYILEAVDSIAFPTTHKSIKDSGIERLMECLEKAKSLCLSLKKAIKENSLSKSVRKMENILTQKEEKERCAVRAMIWPSQEEDEKKNEDEDEDEDEDACEEDGDEIDKEKDDD
ncbi:hypothetical protein BDF14DRAFT_1399682 [Spinellus fusiger]|nr:hypothetical protein BDF14DRAFT_1399682 [Spinellus fusiger]